MPRKQRSYTYNEYLRAMKMVKKLGVAETSRRTGIPKGTLYHWKNGERIPPLTKWIPKPSNELAYISGVLNGDGNVTIYKSKSNYEIQLEVKDYEFAEAFSRAVAKVLNKKTVKPRWYKSSNKWIVIYYSEAFYTWYKQQNLDTLKPYIEYSRETATNFLRGLYDSEGNHYIYKRKYNQIRLSNNNIELLKYSQYLLGKYFNILTTGPYLVKKAGEVSTKRDGEKVKTKHNNYSIAVSRKLHIQSFLDNIGFSITEKQLGLPRRK